MNPGLIFEELGFRYFGPGRRPRHPPPASRRCQPTCATPRGPGVPARPDQQGRRAGRSAEARSFQVPRRLGGLERDAPRRKPKRGCKVRDRETARARAGAAVHDGIDCYEALRRSDRRRRSAPRTKPTSWRSPRRCRPAPCLVPFVRRQHPGALLRRRHLRAARRGDGGRHGDSAARSRSCRDLLHVPAARDTTRSCTTSRCSPRTSC